MEKQSRDNFCWIYFDVSLASEFIYILTFRKRTPDLDIYYFGQADV